MDLKEIGYEDGDWIRLAQDRVQWQDLAKSVMNLLVLHAENFFTIWEIISLSRKPLLHGR